MEELEIPNWVAAETTTGFDLVAYYTGRPIAPSYVPGEKTKAPYIARQEYTKLECL